MKILGIETSCDETAVCLIECKGKLKNSDLEIKILGNALHSQINIHKEFGGVVPMMAKREHANNLIPLFLRVMKILPYPSFLREGSNIRPPLISGGRRDINLEEIFGRETEFKENFLKEVVSKSTFDTKLGFDAIAVTEGPGLEPALWMGIIFAKALSLVYDIPIIPVNHMEGHVVSGLVKKVPPSPSYGETKYEVESKIEFPLISLLISGGHTELILSKDWNKYEIIGETRDDAVGEAFDKVARMLGLPYPGGPEISKLANIARNSVWSLGTNDHKYVLPRPMIKSNDFDFSFSGIKTAVLYSLKNMEKENPIPKEIISREFEDAITEVLISKTMRALEKYNAKSLILGGGVVSNSHIRSEFKKTVSKYDDVNLYIPELELRTDNALMIAIAGYEKFKRGFDDHEIKASGTMRLG